MEYDELMKEIREDMMWNQNNKEGKYPSQPPAIADDEGDPMVHKPSHYTSGKVEVIEIIEEAIKTAPDTRSGFLQGQVLKYILRMWLKNDPRQDAEKARWYLTRLIGGL